MHVRHLTTIGQVATSNAKYKKQECFPTLQWRATSDASQLEAKLRELFLTFKPRSSIPGWSVWKAIGMAEAGQRDPAAFQVAEREAHKLAGVLGSYGLQHGSELASKLEQMFAGKFDVREARTLASQLRAASKAVVRNMADTLGLRKQRKGK
jgi:HPt (histidine-containing phosphotransfer) domain-containing protein